MRIAFCPFTFGNIAHHGQDPLLAADLRESEAYFNPEEMPIAGARQPVEGLRSFGTC